MSEPDWAGGKPYSEAFRQKVRDRFPGVIIGAWRLHGRKKPMIFINKGLIDAVAFGRDYIANPDLVARLQKKRRSTRSTRKPSMGAARKATPITLRCNPSIDSGDVSPLYSRFLIYQINCIGDIMRLLHTMLRVGDLQRSIDFYTQRVGHEAAAH